jgi:rod shape-determining protein MreD
VILGDLRFRVPLVLLTAILVHTTLFSQVRVFGIMPDLMLLLAVTAGLEAGPAYGGVAGFMTGMLADLFLPTPLGLSALVYSVTGYITGLAKAGLLEAAWWFPLATAFVASSAGVGLFALAGTMLGERSLLGLHLATVMLLVGLVNAVLAAPVLRVVRWSLAGRPAVSTYGERA